MVVNSTQYTRLSMQRCAYDVKQCVWFLIVYLRFFMYKSKENNGMDILDSILIIQWSKTERCDELSDWIFINDSERRE